MSLSWEHLWRPWRGHPYGRIPPAHTIIRVIWASWNSPYKPVGPSRRNMVRTIELVTGWDRAREAGQFTPDADLTYR